MATLPSSSSPSSPPSASNSENSATQPTAHARSHHKDVETDNGIPDVLKKIPDLIDPFEDMNSEDYIQKFNKYETDYTSRLMAKYFSDKDIYGGKIFEEKMTIDGETIKASRWPGTQSYADPAQSFRDLSSSSSNSTADTAANISNGKYPVKKEG
uniref:Uncharacterized protein n=1 Tax=Davidia involucrata TaxID=16924 RepID=A0A5B6ZVN4_DAVIN